MTTQPNTTAGVREDTSTAVAPGCIFAGIAIACLGAATLVATVIGAAEILYTLAARLGWVPAA